MDNRPIGIFDSGIGGLTVLKEMKDILPNEDFIYFGDTLNFPYGDKTKNQIISFSDRIAKYLILQNVKMIIIACGTATSQALEELKRRYSVYIEGIIEPTVKYIKDLEIKKIGVIGTKGTIKSRAWETKLKKQIPNIEVINKACPLLAEIAEEGKAKTQKSMDAIHEYMKIFKENKINTIILGCTHYPIFDKIIKKEFAYNVKLINPGRLVAKKVKQILNLNNMENERKKGVFKIIISKNEINFEERAKKILKSSKRLDITYFY